SQSIAGINSPIPIGYNQTNSQPSTVFKMLHWLDPQPGEKILDVGSGSGWTTALLANLVDKKGVVYAVEKVPELVEFGAKNCAKLDIQNVHFHQATDEVGLASYGPYDRILVSAAASQLPQSLLDQLKINGKMVIPIKNSVHIITKTGTDSHTDVEEPGFAFVPLL